MFGAQPRRFLKVLLSRAGCQAGVAAAAASQQSKPAWPLPPPVRDGLHCCVHRHALKEFFVVPAHAGSQPDTTRIVQQRSRCRSSIGPFPVPVAAASERYSDHTYGTFHTVWNIMKPHVGDTGSRLVLGNSSTHAGGFDSHPCPLLLIATVRVCRPAPRWLFGISLAGAAALSPAQAAAAASQQQQPQFPQPLLSHGGSGGWGSSSSFGGGGPGVLCGAEPRSCKQSVHASCTGPVPQ